MNDRTSATATDPAELNRAAASMDADLARDSAAPAAPRPARPALGGEITLRGLLLTLWGGFWLVVAIALLSILLAVVALKLEPPSYTAVMVVAPAQQDLGAASRLVTQLDQYANLAALAQAPARLETATGMDLYLELLVSPELAERLEAKHQVLRRVFEDQWDAATQSWRGETGLIATVKGTVLRFFGYPAWQPPGPGNLADYLSEEIEVKRSGTGPLRRIEISNPDGSFAASLLAMIHETAEQLLREGAARAVDAQIEHLERELATTQESTRAEALRSMLTEQYQAQALLSGEAPFAAQIVSPPAPSPMPTSMSPLLGLALAGAVGVIVGIFVVFLLDALRAGA